MVGLCAPFGFTHMMPASAIFHTDCRSYPGSSDSSMMASMFPLSMCDLAWPIWVHLVSRIGHQSTNQMQKKAMEHRILTHATMLRQLSPKLSLEIGSWPEISSRRITPKL
jgi:hypothetical protein